MLITESVFAMFLKHTISVIVYAPVMLARMEQTSAAACTYSGSIGIAVQVLFAGRFLTVKESTGKASDSLHC